MAGESPIQCGFPWSHDAAAVVLASLAQREGKIKKKNVGIYLNWISNKYNWVTGQTINLTNSDAS